MAEDIRVSPTITISVDFLEFSYSLSGGKGGQHAQKNDTKVQLRFDLSRCDVLESSVKERLRDSNPGLLTKGGLMLISSDRYRSRKRNVEEVRERLVELVRKALVVPAKRRATRPSRGAKERRLDQKRKQSQLKASRTKVEIP